MGSFVSAPLSDLLLDALGRFWIVLGPPLGALWSFLGPLEQLLVSSSAPLGSPWELHGALGEHLALSNRLLSAPMATQEGPGGSVDRF